MAAEKASQEMVETPDDSKAESEQPVVDTEKMQESKKIKKVTVQEPDKGLEWYLIGADVNRLFQVGFALYRQSVLA